LPPSLMLMPLWSPRAEAGIEACSTHARSRLAPLLLSLARLAYSCARLAHFFFFGDACCTHRCLYE